MKILQVLTALSAGGAEGFAANLSVGLASLGTDVRLFLLAGVRRERGQLLLTRLSEANAQVIGIEERRPTSLGNLLRLNRLIRAWRPDIVHAHLYPSQVACSCTQVLSPGTRARYCQTLHSTDICGYRSPTIVRLMDRFYGSTIACSPSVAEAYIDFMGGEKRAKLVTIPNGATMLDSVPNTEERLQARKRLGIPEQAFVVVHIGRMLGNAMGADFKSEPKAQDVLLESFAKAFRGNPNCVLALVGDGPLRPEAERLAESLCIGGQVYFLGEQPEPWPALRAADLFCLPSRFEGLPLALIEASSCGLPVVASDIAEIRSLSLNDPWLLAPVDDVPRFADALLTVQKDLPLFALRARDAAQRIRETFSMKTCAERYLQTYESMLRG